MPNLIYDISPLLHSKIAVFPGDVEFQRRVSLDFLQGHHLSLSSIVTTLHLGAHADAPSHYHPQGKSIEHSALETYLGRCQVMDLSHRKGEISKADLEKKIIESPRVLLKTGSFLDPDQWQDDFCFLAPEAIDYLAQKKVRLVGIDTPSMDYSKSKTLDTHQAFYRHQLAILEGLVLDQVPEGNYFLIALPLKIKDGEASPVRAILMTEADIKKTFESR